MYGLCVCILIFVILSIAVELFLISLLLNHCPLDIDLEKKEVESLIKVRDDLQEVIDLRMEKRFLEVQVSDLRKELGSDGSTAEDK